VFDGIPRVGRNAHSQQQTGYERLSASRLFIWSASQRLT